LGRRWWLDPKHHLTREAGVEIGQLDAADSDRTKRFLEASSRPRWWASGEKPGDADSGLNKGRSAVAFRLQIGFLDPESPTNFTELSFQMTTNQLLRIISFLESVRSSFQELLPCAEEDASWNIVLYIIKQNLLGSKVTFTSLSSTAKVPYATAMRRVHDLIDQGFIIRVPISDTGKRFRLVASQSVLTAFDAYAMTIKSLLDCYLCSRP
jgi:hypothetical protein